MEQVTLASTEPIEIPLIGISHNRRHFICSQLLFEAQQFEFQIENCSFLVLDIFLTAIEVGDAFLTNCNIKPNLNIEVVVTELTDFDLKDSSKQNEGLGRGSTFVLHEISEK